MQQSGYGVAWDCTPQSRAASPRSRLLRTSPASVSGSPNHRPSGADSRSPSAQEITFHICHPVKGRRPASPARKQRAEGCRTPTAEHCSATGPAISPTSQEGRRQTRGSRATTCRCATTTVPQAASSPTPQEGLGKTAASERWRADRGRGIHPHK